MASNSRRSQCVRKISVATEMPSGPRIHARAGEVGVAVVPRSAVGRRALRPAHLFAGQFYTGVPGSSMIPSFYCNYFSDCPHKKCLRNVYMYQEQEQ